MNRLLMAIALVVATACDAGTGAPPHELFAKAASVKLYMYEGGERLDVGILKDFRALNPTAIPAKGLALSPAQVARVKRAFTVATGDQAVAACFVPRHGFVFEDAKGQVIGTLDVCFECSNYSIGAPGYDAQVKPIYARYEQPADKWDEKLQRAQQAEVNRLRATFDMPPTDAPIDWHGLAALVGEFGLPTEPKPADYERLRKASN